MAAFAKHLVTVVGALGLAVTAWAGAPGTAEACGGFFCNGGGGGPTPVVQAAERVIFEQRPDGTVRAYVQIRYDQQAEVGFSWIIPVLAIPEVGIASSDTFDQLDQATNPQFRFVNNSSPSPGGGSGGGFGCGMAASEDRSAAFGAPGTMDVEGVTVWETSRVGDYETAIIAGESAEDLLAWLELNEYDIPSEAAGTIGTYVEEGHMFVAFKYAPVGAGRGTLDPIVLTYRGVKPCVPIRITAVASTPILDIMILAFGEMRATPEGAYVLTEPDYDAVRPDFSAAGQTTYADEVLRAVTDAGGLAFVTEYAAPTTNVGGPAITDREAQALLDRNAFVTRFYTRMPPESMVLDPEFIFPGGDEVARLHVVDITPRSASVGSTTSGLRFAGTPFFFVAAGIVLAIRRRRRR